MLEKQKGIGYQSAQMKKKDDDILLYSAPFVPSAKVILQLTYMSVD